MFKRFVALFLMIALVSMGFGCAKQPASATLTPPVSETPAAQTPAPDVEPVSKLVGFIVADDGSIGAYMAMYGFLHTAENLGYPAKLYRAQNAKAAEAAVEQAAEEGCKGLLISTPGGGYDGAVRLALEKGLHVVVPYDACAVEGISANIVADTAEYVEELARGLSARMTERGLKSGRILVYGLNTAEIYAQFVEDINTYYPQYGVAAFDRAAMDEQGAIDELAAFLLVNRDIKGMYVVDRELAPLAVKARAQAKAAFDAGNAPSPTPAPTPEAGQTPAPTPNPALLTTISITIFASGLSDANYDLFNGSDIYALCIEPYYEAAAQGAMSLDSLVRGEAVLKVSKVNRPIAYADTIDKYLAIQKQVKELFDLG